MSRLAKLLSNEGNSVTFADPLDINHTLRVKVGRVGKTLQGVSLTNNRFEFIQNNTALRTQGDNTTREPIAGRVILSGSIESKAEMLQEWNDLKANVDAAILDGALDGFKPISSTPIEFGKA